MKVAWDATRYADKLPKNPAKSGTKAALASENSMRRQYPPLIDSDDEDTRSSPCIIVDMHGVILAWYLPGILEDSRQVSVFTSPIAVTYRVFQNKMMAATEKLDELLKPPKHGAPSWRLDKTYFVSETESPPGVLDLSPAWFQQGHEVG